MIGRPWLVCPLHAGALALPICEGLIKTVSQGGIIWVMRSKPQTLLKKLLQQAKNQRRQSFVVQRIEACCDKFLDVQGTHI